MLKSAMAWLIIGFTTTPATLYIKQEKTLAENMVSCSPSRFKGQGISNQNGTTTRDSHVTGRG
jgi:hypothetical protein